MTWKLEDVIIFLQKLGENTERITAVLQPVTGYSVIQQLGKKVPISNINYYIVGDTDKDTINGYVDNGTKVTLSGPDGVVGDFYMHTAKYDRQMVIKQTIRTDLDIDEKVYVVSSELFEDV